VALLAVSVCALTAVIVSAALGVSSDETPTVTQVVKGAHTRQPQSPQAPPPDEASPPQPAKKMQAATRAPRSGRPLEGETIGVDPGHNGGNVSDPDAINRLVPAGAHGTEKPCNTTGTETDDGSLSEAQFNWDVARDLVLDLERLGARVVLTRHSNGGVGPCVNERAEIANHAHAAAAISIHADGNLATGVHGFDVIHPSAAESVAPQTIETSLRLAEAEKNALVGAGVPPANYVGSEGFDERADLACLNLAKVPAVLVELGNMREPEEAARLEDPTYRQELADALAAGVVSFLNPGPR
jgi:N-acetylmuramoyl-L-alanine amidase